MEKKTNKKLKQRGITLIALVITIIVLLILAGVSIAMLTGENGILNQTNKAKIETRGSTVEEIVKIWKSEKKMEKYSSETAKTEEEMLQNLLEDKYVFEEEINRREKIITIGDRIIDYNILTELEDDEANTNLKTMILVYEVEENEEAVLPCVTYGEYYDFTVDWGDGTGIDTVNSSNIETNIRHIYNAGGKKEIKINGKFEIMDTSEWMPVARKQLKEIKQWGVTGIIKIRLGNINKDDYNIERISEPSKSSFNVLENFKINNASIISLPERLFQNATNLKELQIQGLSNLSKIHSDLLKNTINLETIEVSFCPNITELPEDLLKNNINLIGIRFSNNSINSLPQDFFKNNKKIEYINFSYNNVKNLPEDLFSNTVELLSISLSNNPIIEIPEKLFENNTKLEDVGFSDTNIETIPENLFINNINLYNLEETFRDCTNLSQIPQNLFVNCTKIENFRLTFYNCTKLTGNLEENLKLWLRGSNSQENSYKGNPDGEGCFYKCKGLDNYEEIPEYWRKEYNEPLPS